MPGLLDLLRDHEPFERLAAGDVSGAGVPTFAQAFVLAGLTTRGGWKEAPVLVVASSQETAEDLEHDLIRYLPGRPVAPLPPRGVWYGSEAKVQPRVAGRRAKALAALAWGRLGALEVDSASTEGQGPPIVVAEAATLLEGVIPPAGTPIMVGSGRAHDFDELIRGLLRLGYTRVDQVEDAGEFSVRGGIIDVFPSTEPYPTRIEFWGDQVESVRRFSVYSQRSLGSVDHVRLYVAAEESEAQPVPIMRLVPEASRIVRVDPALAASRVEAFQADMVDVLGQAVEEGWYSAWPQVEEEVACHVVTDISSLGLTTGRTAGKDGLPAIRASSGRLPVTSLPEAERAMDRLVREGYRVVIAFEQRAEAERAVYALRSMRGTVCGIEEIGPGPGLSLLPVPLRGQFVLPAIKLAVLSDQVLFPRRHKLSAARPAMGVGLSSFRDLRNGDYVVHEDHGVGRFEGLSTKTVAGVTRDYLDLAYRGKDMLYVPHDQIAKVMRYVGSGGAAPSLSKLGGKAWEHLKSRVRKAARQVAGDLLHLYALRQAATGYQFSEDGEWQLRFESTFPFEETEDQSRAIDVIKDDMESARPMDRLLCGDVGYGKTEVALRAAFKAATEGKQVMVLVPTTILAQQHYGTFRERFAEFPVKVDMISRFRTSREQKGILSDFGAGRVDILIGTHRLLSNDVKPKDLGLIIVDEEQRFGVTQKEALRRLKIRVDVLTLSATPIPRTLQMSLSGVRDVTIIETPPRDRHPIQTYVGLYDEGMVKRAIEREIGRGGQVFFLHNRVETIDKVAVRLRTLMPEVRFAVAHGQMPEQALEQVMLEFLRGDHDVLVTTTIIESGLDIPNANTLIVERADLLGLAQLYQIRGRIGRSTRVAHAFLFHPDEAVLTQEAIARLSTLADYTELGAGFKIAMRDLEIRGAGELLGEEQSGHIAAVGFEMYLAMLREATFQLRGEDTEVETVPRVDIRLDAHVPSSFIGYEAARVDLHRRISSAKRPGELAELRAELADRFRELPVAVDNLIFLGEVRVALQAVKADSLTAKPGRVTLTGLVLPPGSRQRLRERDRRYTYAPVQGQLAIGTRGDSRSLRETVQGVLDDILALFEGERELDGSNEV